ncbi:Flagellar protein YcgR [Acididesulfobacillus acetoxydans]|uniref:Flagellar protein YcgR n=1 Tax=Acididesulfobacillus acetoxydans TaxID=1561005 RepID=A0A8S0X712_9FIRM|nr:flagellar brake domain-containing protein [Acididesulfobacillus acetoxydans]CAA7602950.1 Flagellar protein YcgR [Acididesulfobacillus acetoxydans]CEJ05832.1 PilZ domain protein [Acididesulfobacillus acetoxydans]
MSHKEKLKPGLAVELVVTEGEYAGRYRTRIDEVGNRLVSVGAPYRDREIVPVREGSEVEIAFADEFSAYSFDAKVIQRIALPVPVLVLDVPEEIRRVQRRSFVRLPAFYPMAYRSVIQDGLSEQRLGGMLDLSGGGVRFRAKEEIEERALLYLYLQLPTGEIQTPAYVSRVEKDEDGKSYTVSARFDEIPERERDRIIRCIFDLQRTMRKKGLV